VTLMACITGSNVAPCPSSMNIGEPSQISYASLEAMLFLPTHPDASKHPAPWRPPTGLWLPAVGESTISKPSVALLPLIRRSWALSHECPVRMQHTGCMMTRIQMPAGM